MLRENNLDTVASDASPMLFGLTCSRNTAVVSLNGWFRFSVPNRHRAPSGADPCKYLKQHILARIRFLQPFPWVAEIQVCATPWIGRAETIRLLMESNWIVNICLTVRLVASDPTALASSRYVISPSLCIVWYLNDGQDLASHGPAHLRIQTLL